MTREASSTPRAPEPDTAERWAWDYVLSTSLAHKLEPPPVPPRFEDAPAPRRLTAPGRPSELEVVTSGLRTPRPGALREPRRRAQLIHTFLHHELQAAELMAWALLAFPETPLAFRRGLLGVLADEIRHMGLYRRVLGELGAAVGDFPVRDWFWERVPSAPSPAHFVAVMGMGFEGGNLDHAARFAELFRQAGDVRGAEAQELVGAEEERHVRFAIQWFTRFRADDAAASPEHSAPTFAEWQAYLPPPLSPMVMHKKPVNRSARRRAGFSEAFLSELDEWSPDAPGF